MYYIAYHLCHLGGCRGRDSMVVGFIKYLCNQCLSPLMLWVRIPLRRGVLKTTLCDKACQWLTARQWFSTGTLVFSTNKTDSQNISENIVESGVKHHKPNLYYIWVLVLSVYNHFQQCFSYHVIFGWSILLGGGN